MKDKDYFLGFDMGTGSVGWAVTDLEYNLIKINRKYAWGSVLFDTSEGAETRRLNRCARRRHKREKERLCLLRELFEDEIQKVDAGFFHRLQESRYVPEDKRDGNGFIPELPYALFVDEAYTDVDYHREFPTVYHLRQALMTENRAFDVRLVYLAIAHILKNRGHFLANMGSEEINLDFKEIFEDLMFTWIHNTANEEKEIDYPEEHEIYQIESILKDAQLTKSSKKQEIIRIIKNADKEMKELISLISGGKVSLSKLFACKEYENLEENKICFEETSYEEKEEYYASNLEEDFDVIKKAKIVYDWMILSNILKGDDSGYLSVAKVRDYEKHKKDLRILKDAIKEDGMGTEKERRELYKRVFGMPRKGENNYSAYVGNVSINGRKRIVEEKKCIRGELYKFINKQVIPFLKEGERKEYIEQQMAIDCFLPKARIKENSVIPYQLHAKELKKILQNAESYLPFLKEKDETGKSVSEKIMLLLTFRIPYYVGPLNNTHDNAWVVRKQRGKVTPWNFQDKVDEEESAKKFIEKMTSQCTYLKNENVLPMSSLLYEKFMVLNEINNLKIYSEPISVELKQRIYCNLFEHKQKVTVKKLIDYLKSEEGYSNLTKDDISGIDVEIKSSLKSYHAFKQQFTGVTLSEAEKEDIIKDMTLFGAEPKLLKKRLLAKFPDYEGQISSLIKSLKCNAWGRLSYRFLNGIAVDVPGQGKIGTVMYYLWNTNNNLMQIVAGTDSPFGKLIEEENGVEQEDNIRYEMVKDLYVSPAVKKQIWKAVQVLDEITHAMGRAPKRIFVEMAREHTEAKRSVTRKDRLLELYKSLKEYKPLFEQLKNEDNDKLRSDKLYLYYTQLGKCAYTGKTIQLEDLPELYDIDHIYPQSKTADDSMDNRVLVCREANHNKSDIYPLSNEIQTKMQATWLVWKQKGLISEEKYKRLTRTTELTHEELTGFVNRQLVETRQSTKEFIGVLKRILPEQTEIVYSKAGNVSRFRNQFGILKVRELNDLHHAKDAYLNIVVGNVYHLKFTKDVRKYFSRNGTNRTYNLTRMFDYDVEYFGEKAWDSSPNGTIIQVKKTLESDKVLVTRQVYERRCELFDVQPVKKGMGQIPLKSGKGNERLKEIKKYGGYNSQKITYFSLIEGVDKKGKAMRYIAPVPLHLCDKFEKNEEDAVQYHSEQFKLRDVSIIIKRILMQTLMVCEGFQMRLTGKSSDQLVFNNANQLSLEEKYYKTVKEVAKYIKERQEKADARINPKSGINSSGLLEIYDELIRKIERTVYQEMMESHGKTLQKGRTKFIDLSLEDQAIQIYEILKLFQCTPDMPDYTRIGGSKNSGRIRIGMNVTNRKSLAIIHQSVTGIYEKIERIHP